MFLKKSVLFVTLAVFLAFSLQAQTAGQLVVTVTTVSYGGSYSPHHVMAIWVQSKTGAYVKTLLAYAGVRRAYLNNWGTATSSTYNTVDAITSATQSVHGTSTCYWNGANQTGTTLGDDTYNVVMEMTEGGSNKLASYAIKKGTTQQIITPANVAGFSNVTIKWTPASTPIEDVQAEKLYNLYPNPTKADVFVNGHDIKEIQIFSLSGKYLFSTKENTLKLGFLSNGVYIVSLITSKGLIVRKITKN